MSDAEGFKLDNVIADALAHGDDTKLTVVSV